MATNGQTTEAFQEQIARMQDRIAELERENATLEAAWRKRDNLLRFVVKHTPNALAVFDKDLHYMLVSDRYLQDYGLGDQDIIGQHHYAVFPEMPDRWKAVHQRCLSGATEESGEDSFVREDGSTTYNRWACLPWYDSSGHVGGLTVFTEVMTEHKQAEQQLRLAQAALDQSADGMHWMRRDGFHTYVNDTVCRTLGYSQEEFLQMRVADIDPNFPPEAWEPTWNRVKESGSLNFETMHSRKDGTDIPVEVTATYLEFDGQEYICAISRDITERKQAETELLAFQTLVENAPDAIGVTDMQGMLVYINPAFRTQFGLTDDAPALSIPDIVVPEQREQHIAEAVRATQATGTWKGEVTYQRIDGTPFPSHISAFLIPDVNGKPSGMGAIIRDITERKQQEEDLMIFKTLVENAPDAISVADSEGIMFYGNNAYLSLFGYDDIRGEHITTFYSPEEYDRLPVLMQELSETGITQGSLYFRRRNDSTFLGQYSVFALREADNQVRITIAIIRDLTEQMQAEAERAALQQQVIEAQREALRELSTPLIPITDQVVIMPLIGTIDSNRAQLVMESLLEGVAANRARLAIIDITGVSVVDTQVAQALVSAAQAVKLLGAQVMLTGIQPQIAQTLVHLGVDLSGIITRGSLQSGIAAALREGVAR